MAAAAAVASLKVTFSFNDTTYIDVPHSVACQFGLIKELDLDVDTAVDDTVNVDIPSNFTFAEFRIVLDFAEKIAAGHTISIPIPLPYDNSRRTCFPDWALKSFSSLDIPSLCSLVELSGFLIFPQCTTAILAFIAVLICELDGDTVDTSLHEAIFATRVKEEDGKEGMEEISVAEVFAAAAAAASSGSSAADAAAASSGGSAADAAAAASSASSAAVAPGFTIKGFTPEDVSNIRTSLKDMRPYHFQSMLSYITGLSAA